MYNMAGALVLEKNNYQGERIQIERLPSGIYFVKIENSREKFALKLIKK